jgi:hypothetical protein
VKGGFLLDVVVREGPPVLQLLASKDQPLLVGGDALLVLEEPMKLTSPIIGNDNLYDVVHYGAVSRSTLQLTKSYEYSSHFDKTVATSPPPQTRRQAIY